MSDVFLKNNSIRSVSDRAQRVAFWVAIVGLVANTLLFVMYISNDSLTGLLLANYAYYTVAISLIAWASFRNWHFRKVVDCCIAAIYFHMWATAFYDASAGQASTLSFPIMLFIPACLVLVSKHRVLLFYAAAQAILVYAYGTIFLASTFGFDPNIVDTGTLSALIAVMASMIMLVLAIVSYSREKTDHRLLSLVRETERLAAQDPLTGLKNRRAFMEDVDALWANRTPFAAVFIDLDRFKPLNDEYGHAVGDSVLQTIGQRLQGMQGTLTTARFGGDEFAVLVEDQASDAALNALVDSIHKTVVEAIDLDVGLVSVGASLGYAHSLKDGASVSDLLHAADTAMMRSKSEGGGVSKFDADRDDSSLATSAAEEMFRKALQNDQIRPALQPIIEAGSRNVVGYELLARWPNSGLTRDPSPAEFIPIAEKLGCLNELLWTTMRKALPQMSGQDGFLAINVSPSQLASSRFVEGLVDITNACDFDLSRIEIEITEHVAFRNLEENVRTLEAVRALGCKIVLDDFGAGYSSLSLLEELPLDKVKLDKSLQGTQQKRGVLQATIRLASDLGFECCVEGIETEETASLAEALNCGQMQGFYFGHPEIVGAKILPLKQAS
ncbi:MAG: EAL domain-containing protein [Pseudomonadota bacterium]